MKGNYIRSEQVSNDMYVSIDLVEEVIERQLRRYKKKIIDKHQEGAGYLTPDFFDVPDDDDNNDIKIVRTKRFGMKPMFPEDACVQMELLGHQFYIFKDSETLKPAVVYKRKEGNYGIIESE